MPADLDPTGSEVAVAFSATLKVGSVKDHMQRSFSDHPMPDRT
jgi:hypothetical protein